MATGLDKYADMKPSWDCAAGSPSSALRSNILAADTSSRRLRADTPCRNEAASIGPPAEKSQLAAAIVRQMARREMAPRLDALPRFTSTWSVKASVIAKSVHPTS